LLQPLIENAVSHGISHLPEGGWIRLDVKEKSDLVHIEVENTYDPDSPPRRKNGMGLRIVQQRIEARFGAQAAFAVSKDANLFRVTMDFPAERISQA
jgi:LytS/YehU family sensor histidine kinase